MLTWEELDAKYKGTRIQNSSGTLPLKSIILSFVMLLTLVLALHVLYDRRVSLESLFSIPDKKPEVFIQSALYGILIALPLKSILLFAREHNVNVAYSLFFPTLLIAQTGSSYMAKALNISPSMFLFAEWVGLLIGGLLTASMS